MEPKRVRHRFTPKEDQLLQLLHAKYGEDWNQIAMNIPNRSPRQCKDRWTLYLSPSINISPWTLAEDELLLDLVEKIGHKWKLITSYLVNRTEASVKYRYLKLKRQMMRHARLISKSPAKDKIWQKHNTWIPITDRIELTTDNTIHDFTSVDIQLYDSIFQYDELPEFSEI